MVGVGKGKLLEPGPQLQAGQGNLRKCMGQALVVRDISKLLKTEIKLKTKDPRLVLVNVYFFPRSQKMKHLCIEKSLGRHMPKCYQLLFLYDVIYGGFFSLCFPRVLH